MSDRFVDKVVVVTGGASGIGAACVRRFSAEGGVVVITDLNEAAGEALARASPKAIFHRVDVTCEGDVKAAVDLAVSRFGRLDCMINNAGIIGAIGPISQTPAEHWHRTLAVLIDGVFFGTKHAASVMMVQRSGVILNIASIAGVVGGLGPHAYTAAKHAVIGLTKSAGSELAEYGIRVNAVAPGATATPLLGPHRHGGVDKALAFTAETSPLKQPLLADDVANALFFLASDEGRNISGQTIAIDGGRSAFASGQAPFHREPPDFMARSSES